MTKGKRSGEEAGFGGVFKGLADLIEKLGDLAEKGEQREGFTLRRNTTSGSFSIRRAVQLYMSAAVFTAIR